MLALVLLVPCLALAQKHAITHEDVFTAKRLGAPAVSPDGKWVFVLEIAQPGEAQRVTSVSTGARAPLAMNGGTTFHFVTDGMDAAMRRAKDAANGKDVRIGGGVSVIRQYLAAGVIDEMHVALAPVLLGEGEHLFSGLDLHALGFAPVRTVHGENATHVVLRKEAGEH